jgi:urease accessory protein
MIVTKAGNVRAGLISIATLGVACVPTQVMAHPGQAVGVGFVEGVMHPLTAADHIAFLLLIGIWAGMLGAGMRWRIAVAALGAMVAGLLLVPFASSAGAEVWIAISLAAVGFVIAREARPAAHIALAFVALLSLGHGLAHGLEVPLETGRNSFADGFLVCAFMVELVGFAFSGMCSRTMQRLLPRRLRQG